MSSCNDKGINNGVYIKNDGREFLLVDDDYIYYSTNSKKLDTLFDKRNKVVLKSDWKNLSIANNAKENQINFEFELDTKPQKSEVYNKIQFEAFVWDSIYLCRNFSNNSLCKKIAFEEIDSLASKITTFPSLDISFKIITHPYMSFYGKCSDTGIPIFLKIFYSNGEVLERHSENCDAYYDDLFTFLIPEIYKIEMNEAVGLSSKYFYYNRFLAYKPNTRYYHSIRASDFK